MKLPADIKNILAIVLGFGLLYGVFCWQGFIWIAAGIGIPGLLSPVARGYILRIWFRLTEFLGLINSRLLLGLIFFLLLTPIAWLKRLFSQDQLQIRKGVKKGSYFVERRHIYQPEDFEHPW